MDVLRRVLKYLEKGWKESKWQRIARFRLGNDMIEGRYWEEENRMCRLCGGQRRLGSISRRNVGTGMREKVISKKHVRGSWGERERKKDG